MSRLVRFAVCLAALAALPVIAEPQLPAPPIRLGDMLPRVPASDWSPTVVGSPDGRAVLLKVEGPVVYASRSTDGGVTFGDEVAIAAPPTIPTISRIVAVMAGGTVHVVVVGSGLWHLRSVDGGLSWSQPLQILPSGWSPGFHFSDLAQPRLAVGPGGRVAVVFDTYTPCHVYAISSTDAGVSWGGPVRAESTDANSYTHYGVDGAFGHDGTLHVTWATSANSGMRVFYTRSNDGGATFEPERDLDALLIPTVTRPASYYPSMAIADDGGVLIAFWDADSSSTRDRLYVARSTDAGATFGLALSEDLPNTKYTQLQVQAWASPNSPSVLVSMVSGGVLTVRSSRDHGATFSGSQTLATGLPTLSPNWIAGAFVPGAGSWVLAWDDRNDDAYTHSRYSVYASSSVDGGLTWSPRQRASADDPGSATSTVTSAVGFDSGKVLLAMRDGHEDRDRSFRTHVNDGTASPLAFGTARRVGGWHSSVLAPISPFYEFSTASDQAGNVYVAAVFQAVGPFGDVYVWASHDAGRTFAPPVRVSKGPAGAQTAHKPWIAATTDGDVYVAYELSPTALTGNEVRVARSRDFGTTWDADDAYVARFSTDAPKPWNALSPAFGPSLVALPGGLVYVLFSAAPNVAEPGLRLAHSSDHGATFDTSTVEPNSNAFALPCLCAQKDQVFVAYDYYGGNDDELWVRTSQDQGKGWSEPAVVSPGDHQYSYPERISIACDGQSKVTVTWGQWSPWAAHFDGTQWWPATELDPVWTTQSNDVDGAFTPTGEFVLVFVQRFPKTARSTDGGKTFSAPVELASYDATAIRLAVDGMGRSWTTWSGVGVVSRLSSDAGLTFSPPWQVNGVPGRTLFGWTRQPWTRPITAWPAAALIAYVDPTPGGPNLVVNVWDTADFDRDGHAPAKDCNDEDAGTWAAPAEVAALQVTQDASTHVTWQDQSVAAGTSTRYDVVSGDVASLANGFAGATCLAPRIAEASCTDEHGGPAAGAAIYYLARAVNACGTGTYGSRALDAATPCP